MARLSVLQLDTNFPRISGDVGCNETFQCEMEIIKVPQATVKKIVTGEPSTIDLHPFHDAITKASGDLITTSCGFLAPFQHELAMTSSTPFIASSLSQLEQLKSRYAPSELKIMTFDASKLGADHLPKGCEDYEACIMGLSADAHLRDVIENDRLEMDTTKAAEDVLKVMRSIDTSSKAIILECTNLPPYKPEIRKRHSAKIYDILTAIEAKLPGAVCPQYLKET